MIKWSQWRANFSGGLALELECTALSTGSVMMIFSTMLLFSKYAALASRQFFSAATSCDSVSASSGESSTKITNQLI